MCSDSHHRIIGYSSQHEMYSICHSQELHRCHSEDRSRFFRDLPCLNNRYPPRHGPALAPHLHRRIDSSALVNLLQIYVDESVGEGRVLRGMESLGPRGAERSCCQGEGRRSYTQTSTLCESICKPMKDCVVFVIKSSVCVCVSFFPLMTCLPRSIRSIPRGLRSASTRTSSTSRASTPSTGSCATLASWVSSTCSRSTSTPSPLSSNTARESTWMKSESQQLTSPNQS